MKKMIFVGALFLSLSAVATQEFHCYRIEEDGRRELSTLDLTLKSLSQIEVSTDWDIDGIYELNTEKMRMWTEFRSHEHRGIAFKLQGQMFVGRSGYVKQILEGRTPEQNDVTVFFCKPGRRLQSIGF